MIKRLSWLRSHRVVGAAFVSLALWAFVAAPADDRIRLGVDTLAQLGGANPNQVLTQAPCNPFNSLLPCTFLGNGAACNLCQDSTFTDVNPGSNGGYTDKGRHTGCGHLQGGTCVGAVCQITNDTGVCTSAWIIVQ